MKKVLPLTALCCAFLYPAAQDTFSIVAVDSATGQVGSAGASCLDDAQISGGVTIIADLHPGRGTINTQAWWIPPNQNNASARMNEGMSPQQIINWLAANDAGPTYDGRNATYRQYGIADFDPASGSPRAAGYTGANADNYKNHVVGKNYAAQGNILLGQQILDSIQAGFLNTEGGLACKLMAALQGANVPGADTRCMSEGVSSLSAFVFVANPGETKGSFYCELKVTKTPYGVEPIAELQVLFDQWEAATGDCDPVSAGRLNKSNHPAIRVSPNPFTVYARIYIVNRSPETRVEWLAVYDILGKEVSRFTGINTSILTLERKGLTDGVYFYRAGNGDRVVGSGKIMVGK